MPVKMTRWDCCGFWNRKILWKHLETYSAYRNFCSAPLGNAYQPRQVEVGKLDECNNAPNQFTKLFAGGHRTPFRMILPPPNVTGNLHLGHALMATVQDVICRYQRMMGADVEWIPGTDHAGIATQVVVEKKLMKERGKSRHKLGREVFLEEVLKWKKEKSDGIVEDLRKLGCTLNWEKEYFTLDTSRVRAVKAAFIQLFEEGLIKRQNSVVNWSCALESAISDIEVDTLTVNGETELAVPGYAENIVFGRIFDIAYRVCETTVDIIVSTTRPETVLGDVAVAVHPEDERYKSLRNLPNPCVWHPIKQEKIPLIFDLSVEPEFGTGAVKVTPAHDKADFDIAQRHLLEVKPVFDEKGRVLDEYEEFAKMPRFYAREKILKKLGAMYALRGVKGHNMNLPICSRSKDIIEYMVRPQWFLHMQPMADMAAAEVRSGRLQIVPPNFETEWHRWLDDCRDWCISRQLWWGHRIPAYFATDTEGNTCWVAATCESDAVRKATEKLNCTILRITQDNDVLDTWFSSALLPLSAFNWPEENYKERYPLTLMETGHDILFFWVARMAMLGLKLTGEAPFKKILLNGIVCDAHGRKMSKSLGNVVTPQQIVQGAEIEELQAEVYKSYKAGVLTEKDLKSSFMGLRKMFPQGIPECGTDALRFTLLSHNIKSHFINFDVSECYTNKLFLNKIWQATKYTLTASAKLNYPLDKVQNINETVLSMWDRWILTRLAQTLKTCEQSYNDYNFHLVTAALKQFLYANLCDIYVETTKHNVYEGRLEGFVHCATLATCLSWGLQAMSPITPFVCAKLLKHLPQHIDVDLEQFSARGIEDEAADVLDICQVIRQVKSCNKISRKHDPQLHLFVQTKLAFEKLNPQIDIIRALTQTGHVHLQLADKEKKIDEGAYDLFSTAGHLCSFGLNVNEIYKRQHMEMFSNKLNGKKLKKLQAELERYRLRVESQGFRLGASEQVQKKHMERIKQLELEIANIKSMAT